MRKTSTQGSPAPGSNSVGFNSLGGSASGSREPASSGSRPTDSTAAHQTTVHPAVRLKAACTTLATGFAAGARRYVPGVLAAAALCWTVASSLSVYPHSLAYFNEQAGGPKNGHNHLLHSNLDWGQDLVYLKEWADAHPEARPLYVVTEAALNPRDLGLDAKRIPPREALSAGRFCDEREALDFCAISATLFFREMQEQGVPDFTSFYNASCAKRVGYTVVVYPLGVNAAGPRK